MHGAEAILIKAVGCFNDNVHYLVAQYEKVLSLANDMVWSLTISQIRIALNFFSLRDISYRHF